ncbi:chemotaxis response regulator protein-glutamate methylesterase [Thalassotalea euphylliae]|uniref:Protein-glutamate methylesterase/protein-glutamine glutaminase n=1 Tax=Thalassotalea euphylliae TaxID=1655234 RepID=A0A3E0TPV7_9GAMM|nr:chemotaxis response regulator protein-glutamate methylesterase [Thalassotalea euphylliae]REL26092.1 chemotaxis response regulator protein-glutamate methylesterase [Thalassotalea euphylliae]
MAYKVLVVDDSSFFRRRVTDILNQDSNIEVIDVAVNGQEAVDKAATLKPDVITMDIEMPVLNGIEAVKAIMAKSPTAILMFSSLTHEGAKATFEALDAGALDFLPKKFNEIAKNNEDAGGLLRQRVLELARKSGSVKRGVTRRPTPTFTPKSKATSTASTLSPSTRSRFERKPPVSPVLSKSPVVSKNFAKPIDGTDKSSAPMPETKLRKSSGKKYKLLAIGTSTGGPVALQQILTQLPANFPLPIVMVQHMPAAFTEAFANRLNSLCQISVKEAKDGDRLQAGHAYLAPGGMQMLIDGTENAAKIRVMEDNSARVAYKPSVDISFGSAAKIYAGDVLGIILTGMGADGREGSRMLKNKGATIWAQDEASCVVYGMPQAVTKAGLSELSLPLEQVAGTILREIGHG